MLQSPKPFAEIFHECGTDKDNPHQYGPVYDQVVPHRERIRAVLELGVWRGYSLQAWRAAFPSALVVGLDNNQFHCPSLPSIEVHKVDQCDRDGLIRVLNERRFDLIVDDASHYMRDQLCSLFYLWPFLTSGGVYVIEEWDFWPTGQGPGVEAWLSSFPVLAGCELIDSIDRSGRHEPLVVLRKP